VRIPSEKENAPLQENEILKSECETVTMATDPCPTPVIGAAFSLPLLELTG
jgi:hypothetical protein